MPAMEYPTAFNLQTCARQNILDLEPYRCARDDYDNDASLVLLDANENAHDPEIPLSTRDQPIHSTGNGNSNGNGNGTGDDTTAESCTIAGLNRYPDPRQDSLKQLLCNFRNTKTHTSKTLTPANLFLGVGSDEAIDAIMRVFCRPNKDKILVCPPTYSIYSVAAKINDVDVLKIPRIASDNSFALDIPAMTAALSSDPTIKLIYLDSPGNPSGTQLSKSSLESLLHHPTFNGVLVLDEAYIDFSPTASLAEWVLEYPNLAVMQTLSKAFGLASIRLGAAFTSAPIASLLNKLKAPYNISGPTSRIASAALSESGLANMQRSISDLKQQQSRLQTALQSIPGIGDRVGGTDGNWVMYRILNRAAATAQDAGKGAEKDPSPCNETAIKVHSLLAEKRGIVTRFRGKEHGCEGALRITVGTAQEVDQLLEVLPGTIREVWDEQEQHQQQQQQQRQGDLIDGPEAKKRKIEVEKLEDVETAVVT